MLTIYMYNDILKVIFIFLGGIYMKKIFKYLFLVLIPFVSGCKNDGEKQKKFDFEATLADLQKGVKVEVSGTQTYDGKTQNIYLLNTSKGDEFSFIQFKDETKEQKVLHECVVKGEDGKAYTTRLDVSNEYNYYKTYNPTTSEYFVYDGFFSNPFESLSADNFNKESNNSYSLKNANLSEVSNPMTNLFYGNPGLSLDSFKMTYSKDKKLTFDATASFEGNGLFYEFEFTAKVVGKGNTVQADYRTPKFEEVSDPAFEKMLSDLKSNNYTSTVVDSEEGINVASSTYYSNEDKIYYETLGFKRGFYTTEDGAIQEVKKDGDDFYKVGSPFEDASLDEVRPTFNISRACFDEKDGVYTLKDGVEGYMSVITVFETQSEELDSFEIHISSAGYDFINTSGSYKTIVSFFDFGTTDVGFTKDSVLEPVAGTKWSDVVDADSYQLLVNIAGEEAAALIPVPNGYSEWMQFSEEPEYVLFASMSSSTIDDDIYDYFMQLVEAGFMIYEEAPGLNGGVMAIAAVVVNGEDHVLAVECLEDSGMFCIVIYIVE